MKKILSLCLTLLMLAAAFPIAIPASSGPSSPFDDVAADRWSFGSIVYAVNQKYMNGTGAGKFSPSGTLTRAMVATVLWRRQGEPKPTTPSGFSDVPEGKWYSDAIAWAKETGVVNGVSETKFKPEANVTREQLAAMLYRYSDTCAVSVPERADLSPFPDGAKVAEWAREAMSWAVEAALVRGKDDGSLDPAGNATREQFAAIIERFDNTFKLVYNYPSFSKTYTEPTYPLGEDVDFFVSPDGDDSSDGSVEHPFKTWNRAVLAVRGLDRAGRDGITVAFRAGDYGPLSVELTAEDSGTAECPVTYRAYGDGDVVFNDGVTIGADEFSPISGEEKALFGKKAAENIYVADLAGRLSGYTADTIVFSDTAEMTVARFPNKYDDNTDHLIEESATTESVTEIRITNPVIRARISKYHDISDLKLYGFLTFGWYKEMLSVGSFDPDTGVAFISDYMNARSAYWTGGLRWETEADGSIFLKDDIDLALVNVTEELDARHEFIIDRTAGKMYVYGEPENYHFVDGEDRMLTMNNVRYVNVRGIDFYNSNESMIFSRGDGVTVEDCVFSGCCAEQMVYLEIPENANESGPAAGTTVRGCEFRNAAGNGLEVCGCRKGANLYKGLANAVVDNNYFTECNLRFANTGALKITVSGASVTHNYFYSTSWEGMDYRGSSFLTAEYNVFERICYNGDDTGAVNDWDNFGSVCNVIRKNVFLSGTGGMVGRYCAYVDNATGTTFSQNLIYNCAFALIMNGNRDNVADDNIIINTGPDGAAPITVREGCSELTMKAGESGDFSEVLSSSNYVQWKQVIDSIRSDPEIYAAVEQGAPWLLERTYDLEKWDDPNFVINIVVEVKGNRFINLTAEVPRQWTDNEAAFRKFATEEDNLGFTLEENPLFVNPTLGDYRFKDGTGLPDPGFGTAGRY